MSKVFIQVMGRLFEVTRIFTNNDIANTYMASNPEEGVIEVQGNLIFLSRLTDKGVPYAKL